MKAKNLNKVLPVMLSYIVMGFVDIVGVSTGYAKRDFDLSPELAQLIPSMVFVWFFILSIPVGILQHKFGKKQILSIGIFITALGMFIPFIVYTYPTFLLSFILLGVGNTIIQVSSNPLLKDAVHKDRFSSYMSFSQFVKAISSLLGPIIVTFMVAQYNDWKHVFLVYGIISIISGIWLAFTKIKESESLINVTFGSTLALLKNSLVLAMVLSIFLIVGLDVGMNTNIQNLLVQKFNIDLEKASLGISLYFFALMVSRFLGAVLLLKINHQKFLFWSTLLTVVFVGLIVIAPNAFYALILIALIGLVSGNLFPLIFSLTINKMPERANEISALMIMAVIGGAVIPPIMGVVNSVAGISASFLVLLVCAIYIFFSNYKLKNN
jgi:MFS transporter, FHS family, L-fucose permease